MKTTTILFAVAAVFGIVTVRGASGQGPGATSTAVTSIRYKVTADSATLAARSIVVTMTFEVASAHYATSFGTFRAKYSNTEQKVVPLVVRRGADTLTLQLPLRLTPR